jgi:hypothetical protein
MASTQELELSANAGAVLCALSVLIGINVQRESTTTGLVVAAAFLSFLLLFSFFVEGCGFVENIMNWQ